MQKLLTFIRSYFCFISITLGDEFKKICSDFCQRVSCLCFPQSFIVSIFTFRSLIHFAFILVYGVRECSKLILHLAVQFS